MKRDLCSFLIENESIWQETWKAKIFEREVQTWQCKVIFKGRNCRYKYTYKYVSFASIYLWNQHSWTTNRWNVWIFFVQQKIILESLDLSSPKVKCMNSAVDISLFSRCRKRKRIVWGILLSLRGTEVRNRKNKTKSNPHRQRGGLCKELNAKKPTGRGLNWLHTCCDELSH